VIAAARNGSVESGGLQPISHEPDPSDPRSLVPYLPLTAYQADSAGAILTIAQSQVSGVTSPNSIRTEVGGLCLTILKDFAHLPVAPPVVHRSIPEPVLHNLWDGDVIPTQSSDSISEGRQRDPCHNDTRFCGGGCVTNRVVCIRERPRMIGFRYGWASFCSRSNPSSLGIWTGLSPSRVLSAT
jgi:hypothetical protein